MGPFENLLAATSLISNYYSYHYSRYCEDGELMFGSEIANKGISIVEQE